MQGTERTDVLPSSDGAAPASHSLSAEREALQAERDALQREVDLLAAQLNTFTQVRDEFLATVSHDLKAPLTSILAGAQYIDRLLAAPTPRIDEALRWTTVIQDQVRTMTLLINDLLDASRVQTGALQLQLIPCVMEECVDTVIGRLDPDMSARVRVTIPAQSNCCQWDRQRIEQVLSNLVGNALKYSPPEESVSLVVENRAEEIEVSVCDHGIGIDPEDMPRVFERYYRSPQVSTGSIPGTGLGLYICQQIVSAHGGRLWAESAGVGHGSQLHFILPCRPPVAAAQASAGRVAQ